MSIKEIRSEKGFTQQDVERESGIPQSYYSRIERGQGNPTIGQFLKLSELYRTEVDELVRAYLDSREEVVSLLARCAAVTRRRSSVCAPGVAVA